MPVKYTVNESGTFVNATATGELALHDVEAHWREIINDDRIKNGFRHLFDATYVKGSQLNMEAFQKIRELTREGAGEKRGSQLAIVASTDASFDNARNYERLAERDDEQVIVFNSPQTAKIWLGVDDAIGE